MDYIELAKLEKITGSQGTGIYLINNPDQLKDTNSRQLVQAYIDHPYLMNDGLKFDFRIYAVIKSINPLSIYVAREGCIYYIILFFQKYFKIF